MEITLINSPTFVKVTKLIGFYLSFEKKGEEDAKRQERKRSASTEKT